MSYSVATMVQRIRWLLGDRPWEDSSCSTASASSTVTGTTADYWVKGDIGEFITDGDTFLTISQSGTTVTATRSYDGSTGSTHTTERVLKNPTFRYNEITNAISTVIKYQLSWPRVYKVATDTITPDPATTWYDFASDALAIVRVGQRHGASDEKWGQFGERHSSMRVEFRNGMPSGLVASTVGLRFPDGFYHPTNTVYIDYASKIGDTIVTTNYSDFTDSNAVVEAIILGAAALLADSQEFRKPRLPTIDADYKPASAMFRARFREALANTEKELRLKNRLMVTLAD